MVAGGALAGKQVLVIIMVMMVIMMMTMVIIMMLTVVVGGAVADKQVLMITGHAGTRSIPHFIISEFKNRFLNLISQVYLSKSHISSLSF